MTDNTRPDGDGAERRCSRRRLLALAGTGVAGSLAGCGGRSDGDGTTTATTTEPTTTEPTDTTTTTASETTTETTARSTTAQGSAGSRDVRKNGDYDFVVAADGSGDYESVQAAIDAVPDLSEEETRIFIEAGRYKEKLRLPESKANVTFVGESVAETVLTYDDHANKPDPDGEGEIGTSGSSSFFVDGPDFTARDVTFENAADPVAQAVAVRSRGDRAVYLNCRFLGYQDTLYTRGHGTREFYRDCYIEGGVDFVFGGATAVFRNCELFCVGEGGAITAASTPQEADFGYVFDNCRVTGDAPDDSFYLGRPWYPYATVVFMNSFLGDHVKPVGWDDWGSPQKRETAFYAEYGNEGPGWTPGQRAYWTNELSALQARQYTLERIFDGWVPTEQVVTG